MTGIWEREIDNLFTTDFSHDSKSPERVRYEEVLSLMSRGVLALSHPDLLRCFGAEHADEFACRSVHAASTKALRRGDADVASNIARISSLPGKAAS